MTQGLKKSALFAASLFVTGAMATVPFATVPFATVPFATVPFATAGEAPSSSAPSASSTAAGSLSSPDSLDDLSGDKISAERTIDLLVLYTGDAEEEHGGEAEITDAINEGVEGMNRALDRSDIEGKVNLAHAEKIDFQETDNQGDAMTWAREDDGVQELRDEYSADLVSVVVSGAAGIAQSPIPNGSTDDMAFSVVGTDWLRPDEDAGDRPSNLKKLFDETIPFVADYR